MILYLDHNITSIKETFPVILVKIQHDDVILRHITSFFYIFLYYDVIKKLKTLKSAIFSQILIKLIISWKSTTGATIRLKIRIVAVFGHKVRCGGKLYPPPAPKRLLGTPPGIGLRSWFEYCYFRKNDLWLKMLICRPSSAIKGYTLFLL